MTIKGKHHTEESKRKIGIASSIRNRGRRYKIKNMEVLTACENPTKSKEIG